MGTTSLAPVVAAAPRVSSASTISHPPFRSPVARQGTETNSRLKTVSETARSPHLSDGGHDHRNSMFTIHRKPRSRSTGNGVHDHTESAFTLLRNAHMRELRMELLQARAALEAEVRLLLSVVANGFVLFLGAIARLFVAIAYGSPWFLSRSGDAVRRGLAWQRPPRRGIDPSNVVAGCEPVSRSECRATKAAANQAVYAANSGHGDTCRLNRCSVSGCA